MCEPNYDLVWLPGTGVFRYALSEPGANLRVSQSTIGYNIKTNKVQYPVRGFIMVSIAKISVKLNTTNF